MRRVLHTLWTAVLVGCTGEVAPPDDTGPFDADDDGFTALVDCDDDDPLVGAPVAEVIGDGVDQDCDGLDLCAVDHDGDGFGDRHATTPGPLGCMVGGLSPTVADCDDTEVGVHPGALETCDGIDQDCDGVADDGLATTRWILDGDRDGFGDPTATFLSCRQPPGYVAVSAGDDCDDGDATVHPGADEIPGDGIDQDCDEVDHCWPDGDGDGFGTGTPRPGAGARCAGFGDAAEDGDCDDTDPTIQPDGVERCGTVDRDCDGTPGDDDPDAVDPTTFYLDDDGDGVGLLAVPVLGCVQPEGTATEHGDCNDLDDTVNPSADERCNGVDDDCDGATDDADDDVVDIVVWHKDGDRDGYGDPDSVRIRCAPIQLWDTTDDQDCDDGLDFVNPGAPETAGNTIDEDCDGALACFVDGDGDGAPGPTRVDLEGVASCEVPGHGTGFADCDDEDPTVQLHTFYADGDSDGFGREGSTIRGCVLPVFFAREPGDCDDTRPSVNPRATEVPGNLQDDDCDGVEVCFVDADDDGVGGDLTATDDDPFCGDEGLTFVGGDCDDGDPAVHPDATEGLGDGVDQDCDGRELCFVDRDGDGVGGRFFVEVLDLDCTGNGLSATGGDCDDQDGSVAPGLPERCGPADDNCNGLLDDADPTLVDAPAAFDDADGDGLGDPATGRGVCALVPGLVRDGADCDDSRAVWGTTCPWAQLAVADDATCGLRTDGSVVCTDGVPPWPEATALAARGDAVCALDPDGHPACTVPEGDPRGTAPDVALVTLDVGPTQACGLDAEGTPWCWGDGPAAPQGPLTQVGVADGVVCGLDAVGDVVCTTDGTCHPDAAGPFDDLAVGDGGWCGRADDGTLTCLGCATWADDAPTGPLAQVLAVDAAVGACATGAAGVVHCWSGAPGAPAGTTLDDVAVGTDRACGLDADRIPVCWGDPGPALPAP